MRDWFGGRTKREALEIIERTLDDLLSEQKEIHAEHEKLRDETTKLQEAVFRRHFLFAPGSEAQLIRFSAECGKSIYRTVKLIRDLGYGWRVLDERNEKYYNAYNSELTPIEKEPEPKEEMSEEGWAPFRPDVHYSASRPPFAGDTVIIATRAGSKLEAYANQYATIEDTNGSWVQAVTHGDTKLMLGPGEYVVMAREATV